MQECEGRTGRQFAKNDERGETIPSGKDTQTTPRIDKRGIAINKQAQTALVPDHPGPRVLLILHLHRAQSRLPFAGLALGRAAPAPRATGMTATRRLGRMCTAFIDHRRIAMQRAHDGKIGRANHAPRDRIALRAAGRIAAFANGTEQGELLVTGSAFKRINRHGDGRDEGEKEKKVGGEEQSRPGRIGPILHFPGSAPGGRNRTRAGGDCYTTNARSVPPTIFVGPSAFGVMSKLKMSVGRYSVAQAFGMSTIPLILPCTGAVPRIA